MLFFNANFICYYFYPTKKREEPKFLRAKRGCSLFSSHKKTMPAFWSGMVFYFPVLAFPGFPVLAFPGFSVFVFTGCMFSPRFSGRSVFPVVKVLSF